MCKGFRFHLKYKYQTADPFQIFCSGYVGPCQLIDVILLNDMSFLIKFSSLTIKLQLRYRKVVLPYGNVLNVSAQFHKSVHLRVLLSETSAKCMTIKFS